jgi:hypothetical protein
MAVRCFLVTIILWIIFFPIQIGVILFSPGPILLGDAVDALVTEAGPQNTYRDVDGLAKTNRAVFRETSEIEKKRGD